MSQLLFFDLDDTLLDHAGSEGVAQEETHSAFPELFAGVPFDAWIAAYRIANRELWDAYGRGEVTRPELQERRFSVPLSRLGLDASRAPEVAADYIVRYEGAWRLNEGAEEILLEAKGLGTVGILSNGFRELQRRKVARFGLDRWVAHVVLSEEVGAMKPDRRIFDVAVAEAAPGEEPRRIRKVYVGDSYPHDVEGARGAGWFPILYNPKRLPVPGPVLWVASLADVRPLLE